MVIGFILGLCGSLFLASMFYMGFSFGRNYGTKKVKKETKQEKEARELLEKEQRKRQQGLNNIMDYDVDVAMGRRKQD